MKRILLTFIGIIIFAFSALSQDPPNGDCPPENTNCLDPAPLDTGVVFLLIAGTVFGLKKIRDHQRGLKNLQPAE